jgi:hypothetical protein
MGGKFPGEVSLSQGSTIYLGQVELKVVAVSLAAPNKGILQHSDATASPSSSQSAPPQMLYPMVCSVPIAIEFLPMSGWIWDVRGVAPPWRQRQVF